MPVIFKSMQVRVKQKSAKDSINVPRESERDVFFYSRDVYRLFHCQRWILHSKFKQRICDIVFAFASLVGVIFAQKRYLYVFHQWLVTLQSELTAKTACGKTRHKTQRKKGIIPTVRGQG